VSRRSSFCNSIVQGRERTRADPSRVMRIKKLSVPMATKLHPENVSCATTLLENFENLEKHPFHSLQSHRSHRLDCIERPSEYLQLDHRLLSQSGRRITPKSMSSHSLGSLGYSPESSVSDAHRSSSRPNCRGRASATTSISSSSRRSPLSTMRYVRNVLN